MAAILILYSSTDGQTKKICQRMQRIIEGRGHKAVVEPIADSAAIDLASFDKIVIGASIRYGKHNASVYRFIKDHQSLLESKANGFFSVNVVARKPAKRQPDTNPYVRRFLGQIAWQPQQLAVFAGRLDYQRYGVLDRAMIRAIMWLTKGPTDPQTDVEYTDWQAVDAFAVAIAEM